MEFWENFFEKKQKTFKSQIGKWEENRKFGKLGEDKLVGFLVGQLMKQSNGSINPGMAKDLLLKELKD